MNKFEGVQAQILESNAKNQLVSAGAGSGKTTIMIEKIANMILSGVSIDSLLVVTFTVLAAAEMKERLIKKFKEELITCSIEDKERILCFIEQVKTASIDTIDGFNSKTIKKYFYELNISPNFEIISDNTRDYYLSKAMRKTIKDFEKQAENSNLMLDLFAGNSRNFKPIEELIMLGFKNVINLKDYNDFLTHAQNQYDDSLLSERIINNYLNKEIGKLQTKLMYESVGFSSDVKNKINAFVEDLNSFNVNLNFVANLKWLQNLKCPDFSTKECNANVGLRDLVYEIKDFFDIKEKFKKHKINEDFNEKNQKICNYSLIFINLLRNFIDNYNNLKEKNNLIDFNDLSRLMLKLLNIKEIREDLQQKYKYIFIDEYQDVNPLQDELMALLTGKDTTVFMVGDVKQSIYGFRGAIPELFLEKYNNLKNKTTNGFAFDMNNNFRSSPTILEFINEVFSHLMTVNTGDINYKKDALIEPKRDDIVNGKVKMMFIANKRDGEKAFGTYSVKEDVNERQLSVKHQEAMLVLKTITELIGTEFYDANLKQNRILTYKDIAILSRNEKDDAALELIEVLKENNVPLKLTNSFNVNTSETVKLIISILKCVANIADDVDYLALFMSMTSIDINDIVEIRNKEKSLYENLVENLANKEIENGFNIIKDIKNQSFVSNNSELIRYILNEKSLRYYLLCKENGNKEIMLVEEFLNKISSVEDGLNLCEFIEIVESSVGSGSEFASQDNEDSVTFQTIHKSKGLEYPVVILYNSGKQFHFVNEHEGINFDADIGLGFDYFDVVERTRSYSLTKFAIDLKNKEKAYKEEMRLLYVALTRAKNYLYITGTYSQTSMKSKKFKKTSFSHMLLDVFVNRLDGDITELKNCEIELVDDVGEIETVDIVEEKEVDLLYENFVYPNENKFNISFKNTVTGLNSKKSQEVKFSTQDWLNPNMQYEVQEDKAKIGTNYHTALEKLDFKDEYVKNTDFEDVDYSKIEKAHAMFKKLVENSINVYKEADFEMYVPYNELVECDIDDKVIVQGVVDLIIERENSIDIVDYKFSSLRIDLLKEKYKEQLNLYKKAVESAFNKKVENIYIYSINENKLG